MQKDRLDDEREEGRKYQSDETCRTVWSSKKKKRGYSVSYLSPFGDIPNVHNIPNIEIFGEMVLGPPVHIHPHFMPALADQEFPGSILTYIACAII